ncbi:unnamed protein product [Heligmosomoides polygyrus]|uniref:Uncharacterized protein n=1 Tax=Heligmosomoides polygyrus TaxID=6339 RepID=A0A183FB79_HELPZ|nr:unnamed protein product [Heligmosomoides polygyrus]
MVGKVLRILLQPIESGEIMPEAGLHVLEAIEARDERHVESTAPTVYSISRGKNFPLIRFDSELPLERQWPKCGDPSNFFPTGKANIVDHRSANAISTPILPALFNLQAPRKLLNKQAKLTEI